LWKFIIQTRSCDSFRPHTYTKNLSSEVDGQIFQSVELYYLLQLAGPSHGIRFLPTISQSQLLLSHVLNSQHSICKVEASSYRESWFIAISFLTSPSFVPEFLPAVQDRGFSMLMSEMSLPYAYKSIWSNLSRTYFGEQYKVLLVYL